MIIAALLGGYFARVYGGSNNDEAFRLHQASDGFYITGSTWSYTQGNDDYLIMKIDTSGQLLWAVAVGDTGGELGLSVTETPSSNGEILLAGGTTSYGAGYWDLFLGTISPDGQLTSSKVMGGSDADGATFVTRTSDGGYLVCGATRSWGEGDNVLVVKLDGSLNPVWARSIGGPGDEEAVAAVETEDGYVVVGLTSSWGAGYDDMLVLKLNTDGQLLWAEALGGVWDDTAYSVARLDDGGLLVAGVSSSTGLGNLDIVLLELGPRGGLRWAKAYGGPEFDKLFNMRPVNGGFGLIGATESYFGQDDDLLFFKVNSEGHVLWATGFGGDSTDFGSDFAEVPTGFVLLGGYESQGAGGWDYFLVSVDWGGGYPDCAMRPENLLERDVTGLITVTNLYSIEVLDAQLEVSDASFQARQVTSEVQVQDVCEPQGVAETPSPVRVIGSVGGLEFSADRPLRLSVYGVDGRLIKSLRVSGQGFVSLRPGVYLWEAGGRSGVVAVR